MATATNGNYRVQVTLKDADLLEVQELISLVTQDVDIEAEEFTVELFEQKEDGTWEGIGLPES